MIEWEGKERDLVRLQHMNKAIQLIIEQFCKGKSFKEFEEDEFFQSAVVRQFEVLGEASNGISEKMKEKHRKSNGDRCSVSEIFLSMNIFELIPPKSGRRFNMIFRRSKSRY